MSPEKVSFLVTELRLGEAGYDAEMYQISGVRGYPEALSDS